MKKKLTKRITSAVVVALIFATLPAGIDFFGFHTQRFLLERQEPEDFFVYHKVQPAQETFSKDEELKMISFLDVKKRLSFRWNDILRCDYLGDDQGYTFIGAQDSSADNSTISDGKVSQWVWDGPKPQTPADCIIESNITADVGLGVEKPQKILSDDFRIE